MEYGTIAIIAGIGAIGGFTNVFVGDAGFHLPKTIDGVWQPGFLGVVFIGAVAAVTSWASLRTAQSPSFGYGDIANAIIVGFGGAKWLKSESEKALLRKTASIAAGKTANQDVALRIASATPLEALQMVKAMN